MSLERMSTGRRSVVEGNDSERAGGDCSLNMALGSPIRRVHLMGRHICTHWKPSYIHNASLFSRDNGPGTLFTAKCADVSSSKVRAMPTECSGRVDIGEGFVGTSLASWSGWSPA